MSVLINIKMPKKCSGCPFFDYYLYGCKTYSCGIPVRYGYDIDTKPDWCQLIEVPEHGRLIDADKLILRIEEYIEEYSDVDADGYHNLKWCAMVESEMAINDAPTVIEASEVTS